MTKPSAWKLINEQSPNESDGALFGVQNLSHHHQPTSENPSCSKRGSNANASATFRCRIMTKDTASTRLKGRFRRSSTRSSPALWSASSTHTTSMSGAKSARKLRTASRPRRRPRSAYVKFSPHEHGLLMSWDFTDVYWSGREDLNLPPQGYGGTGSPTLGPESNDHSARFEQFLRSFAVG
jgi:hypothetical protein